MTWVSLCPCSTASDVTCGSRPAVCSRRRCSPSSRSCRSRVGVGVTTAVYSVVDRVFWKELGIAEPNRGAGRSEPRRAAITSTRVMSEPDFIDLPQSADVVRYAVSLACRLSRRLRASPRPRSKRAKRSMATTSRCWVSPLPGARDPGVRRYSAAAVVVLSHALWRQRFRGDAAVIGQVVRLSGRPFEIIGVTPESFEGPLQGRMGTRLWVPRSVAITRSTIVNPASTAPDRERRRSPSSARLRQGAPIEQARTEIETLGRALDTAYPAPTRVRSPGITARRGWSPKTWPR